MKIGGDTYIAVSLPESTIPIRKLPTLGKPRVDQLGAAKYALRSKTQVVGYNPTTGQAAWHKATALVVTPNQSCFQITTARNRELVVDNSRGVLVFDSDAGRLTKVSARDAVGCCVPFIAKEPSRPGYRIRKQVGWWYGVLLGSGRVQSRLVSFHHSDPKLRGMFLRIAKEKIFDEFSSKECLPMGDKYADPIGVRLYGRRLVKAMWWLRSGKLRGHQTVNKKIPNEIMASRSRTALLGMLSGFLESTGALQWNHATDFPRANCRSDTSNPELVQQLIRLGRKVGVRTSISSYRRRTGGTGYVVWWSLADIYQVLPELYFVGEAARHWQRELFFLEGIADSSDIVPVSRPWCDLLTPLLYRNQEYNRYRQMRSVRQTGRMRRETARFYLEKFARIQELVKNPVWAQFQQMVENTGVHWDRITRVDNATEQEVFELEVAGPGTLMLNNGLVICGRLQYPATACF